MKTKPTPGSLGRLLSRTARTRPVADIAVAVTDATVSACPRLPLAHRCQLQDHPHHHPFAPPPPPPRRYPHQASTFNDVMAECGGYETLNLDRSGKKAPLDNFLVEDTAST